MRGLLAASVIFVLLLIGPFAVHDVGGPTVAEASVADVADPNVVIVATLPNPFNVMGPYGNIVHELLGVPLSSPISSTSLAGKSSVRVAWHVFYLTVIMPNGGRVTIESKAQVIQVRINGNVVTITPNYISPSYTVELVKGSETLSALMSVARQVLRRELKSLTPPTEVQTAKTVKALIPIPGYFPSWSSVPKSYLSQQTAKTVKALIPIPGYFPSWSSVPKSYLSQAGYSTSSSEDQTWALSSFANVTSSSEVCGYVYPINDSNLVIPTSDYAGVPLTIFQELKNSSEVEPLVPQAVAQLWPPALIENVWVGPGLLSIGAYPLTSPAGWLATGVTLSVTQSNLGNGNYEISLKATINGQSYTMAKVHEAAYSAGYYNISASFEGTFNSTGAPAPVLDSVAYSLLPSLTVYPSMAFETSDTSSSFFGNNGNFALEFSMGNGQLTVGEWPLYYSISDDIANCKGIWGSSGIGSSWPPSPSSSNHAWGASGSTTELRYDNIVSYDAGVGSLSQMGNNGFANTVGILCSYVDTNLSSLNYFVVR